ncbi:bifunctional diguanylate cyclase/phosphodiesterase [Angustibacter sp. Root456]|uniref:putative bifunctional diguanylate cyclase/phosphodiesterase n=1 Tax=Angustibacter sp. Root456 TaxID=1736539 RepID=UPI000A7C1505|nr:EAL domain-containing protein [Angustibacter sp. Root456]
MTRRGQGQPGAQWVRRLGRAAWVVAALGAASSLVLPGPDDGAPIRYALVVTLLAFFALQVIRLLFAAALHPARRLALLFLTAGVGLWAAGAATVGASQAVELVRFPAPGEALYLLSYLGMAAFLLLDVAGRRLPALSVWLEAAVVCGAAACVSAFAVLSPLALTFERGGLALLLAILYPLIDLVLGTIVLAQLLLRQRERTGRTAALALAFLGLAVADSSFLVSLKQDTYSTNVLLDILWGVSFAVLVGAACTPPRQAVGQGSGQLRTRTLVVAAGVGLLVLVVHPGGTIGWVVTVPAIITLVGAGARMVLALREARGAAEALRLSLTDELTGLPNRRAVLASADESLRERRAFGFMLLDLDGFKDINDSLGHGTGDEVLIAVARRMRDALPSDVVVARLGGDEFALLSLTDDDLELLETARRVREVLMAPLHIDNLDLAIGASIGITVAGQDDASATDLLRRADVAMYEAKESRSGALLYDTAQDGYSRQRLRRGEELRHAIASNELVLWYQPQVDAVSRRVTAMEALVRWQHPREGLLSPMLFLSEARRAGLMPALSDAVMRMVVSDTRAFVDAGYDFRVAMNCAPPELLGGQLLPRLYEELAEADLPGDSVLIEVTEDSFLSDPERARDALYDLREHEVQASIDDYGTGFSSLAYLRDLPVQELKIDRSFVSALTADHRTRLIVQTTTQMAHAMGLRVVAEGVEDEQTATELVAMKVDVLQGYHIAAPMPPEQVGPWLRRWATGAGRSTSAGTTPSVA